MIFVHKVQGNKSQNSINAWFNFILKVHTCIIKSVTQITFYHRPTVGRPSAEWRPISVSVCRRFFDKTSSTDRLAIIGRLTPDDRATFGRYHDVNFFKKSADCRPIIGRPSPDASPMTKPMKIGGSVNETFNLGASTRKSSADQKFSQNRCRHRPTIGRRRPIFQNFARNPSADRRFG